jgi:hypothetical protein
MCKDARRQAFSHVFQRAFSSTVVTVDLSEFIVIPYRLKGPLLASPPSAFVGGTPLICIFST